MYKITNEDYRCVLFFESMNDVNRFFDNMKLSKPFYKEGFKIRVVRGEECSRLLK